MTKPEIGLSMLYCLDKPFSFILKHLTEFNIKHIEIDDEGLHTLNKRRVKRLKEIAQEHNLDFVVHAPWAGINIATPSSVLRHATIKRLKKSICYARQLSCRMWLFHPGSKTGLSHIYPEEDWKLNLNSVQTLLKFAKKEGVEIAIENTPEPFPSLMKTVDDFSRFYHNLNDDIGIVLDVAHAYINDQIPDFINHFSSKIVHIHLSDNDGKNDLHLGVGYGSIDWKSVAKAINAVDYSNLLMIESVEHVEDSVQRISRLFF